MDKKFEINQTKIKGSCQSGRKVLTHNSKSDLPPEIVKWNLKKTYLWLQWNVLFKVGNRGLYDLQCRYFHLLLHLSVVHLWSLENWSRSSLVCKYVCIFSLNKKNVAWGTIAMHWISTEKHFHWIYSPHLWSEIEFLAFSLSYQMLIISIYFDFQSKW